MDLWDVTQKFWCVLSLLPMTDCVKVSEDVSIKSTSVVLLFLSLSLSHFVLARQSVRALHRLTFSVGDEQPEHHGLSTKSDIFTPCVLLCCELCYMHDRKSVFTFLFSTHVYKKPATEFMYRFCTGCLPCHFFQHL